ncbi:MAG: SAM-dependent methyltransferase [Armatimonadota bacterium]|nr:SAM-dependent methyltransferase [Armatimonadota bacterium]
MAADTAIRVIGLGPAGLGGMSLSAMQALQESRKVFVRTKHHPAVAEISDRGIVFESFDRLYELAEDFEELYREMAERVLAEASEGGVVYAVPGHPLVGERSVELLLENAGRVGARVEIVCSPSFIEATLEALRIGLDRGLKILDALQIEALMPSLDTPNLIYQVYDRDTASRVKLRLMEFFSDESKVWIVQGAGTDDPRISEVALYELDRREFDHLTSVYVPGGVLRVEG